MNFFRHIFSFLFLLVIIPFASHSQDTAITNANGFNIKDYSLILPQALPSGTYRHGFAIYYVVPPKDWTLDIIKAPMFTYNGKYALPKNFTLQGTFSTILVSTRINAGPFWNYSKENFHAALGYQVAYNLGYLTSFGFSTKLVVWEQQPSITFGYSFEKYAVTLRGDLYYTGTVHLFEGGHETDISEHFLNGYSIAGSLEQRLHKDRVMSIGLKMNYIRYHIVAWAALPVNSYHYWVPEIQVGINF